MIIQFWDFLSNSNSLGCLARERGISCLGIPLPSLRVAWRRLCYIDPLSGILAKLHLTLQCFSCWGLSFLVSCSKWNQIYSDLKSSIAYFQWGSHLNHWKECNNYFELHILILAWCQSMHHFISAVSFRNCVIFQAELQCLFANILEERSPVKGLLSFTEVIRGLANQSMYYFRSDLLCDLFFRNF